MADTAPNSFLVQSPGSPERPGDAGDDGVSLPKFSPVSVSIGGTFAPPTVARSGVVIPPNAKSSGAGVIGSAFAKSIRLPLISIMFPPLINASSLILLYAPSVSTNTSPLE